MKTSILSILVCLAALAAVAPARENHYSDDLTCRPVNGTVRLPGIAYDDLTSLARSVFSDNPAAVTDALYALPFEERDDFLDLYLEPHARERHRLFFSRCRDVAELRALETAVDRGERIPERLRAELAEQARERSALREGAIPFRIGDRLVYIPVPSGYVREEGALFGYLKDAGVADSLAVFGRREPAAGVEEPFSGRNVLAVVQHVRGAADSFDVMLDAYRAIVDNGWRAAPAPSDAVGANPVAIDYRWNLQPFAVREYSFCYGRFDKTVNTAGEERIRYRVTALVILPGCSVQVAVAHSGHTDLDTVDAMNVDLVEWRDAIMAANWFPE